MTARPLLFASVGTVAKLSEARAVALLVGSYDGSGNFGDIAQLDANLELLEPLAGELLVLPVLELSRLRDHAELSGGRLAQALATPLFMGPGEPRPEDELVPVRVPARLDFAALFLYGGGYLNRFWGRRKLDMLAAAEGLVANAAAVRRLGSGLQAEAAWLAELAGEDRERLTAFELLGARDPRSRQALAELAPAAAFESGDDAVGVLAPARTAAAPATPAGGRRLRLNVHYSEHDFVAAEPAAVRELYLRLLAALAREAGRPLSVQPLIAYLDRHLDERPGWERLGAECEAAGIEVAEPLLLTPARVAEAAATIAPASLTLSCSYHAALASLICGVPVLGVRENAYYEQKLAGLRASFDLPAELIVDSGRDPEECARQVAALVLDEARGAALRARLHERSAGLAARRRRTEAKVLAQLDPGEPRLLSPAAAERRAAAACREAAVARAQLNAVLGSRSWRLTGGLRHAAAALRRLRGGRGRR